MDIHISIRVFMRRYDDNCSTNMRTMLNFLFNPRKIMVSWLIICMVITYNNCSTNMRTILNFLFNPRKDNG